MNEKGMSAGEARALAARVLDFSRADQARVNIQSGWRGYTRVATNRITSAGGSSDVTVRITSVFGRRVASVTSNAMEEEALGQAVRRSEDLARIAPENPEYLAELGAPRDVDAAGYYESTGAMAPEARAAAAALSNRAADRAGLVAAGYMDVRAGSEAVATSNGLFAYHRGTGVASTLTVRTRGGDSSGWAGDEAADWNNIESTRIARHAVEKCQAWRGRTRLDPGRYTVVLEPAAVGMLMSRMRGVFNARTADEGRSFFSKHGGGNRLGEPLFDPKVTLRSDPSAADAETAPFTNTGEPAGPQTWVEGGVLKNLAYSRPWAERQNAAPRPGPTNLLMAGGPHTLEDLIASTERGVLLTRFWYIRGLNPRTLSYTGLTRDGTFLIEKGRVSRPVYNFRFNQSLVEMLNNVEMVGQPTRVAASENSSTGTPIIVPPLKVHGFNLASVSDAI